MNESINDVLMNDFKLCVKSLKKSEKKCEKLQQENKQLKDRIDKAINLLQNNQFIWSAMDDEILEILKGENND